MLPESQDLNKDLNHLDSSGVSTPNARADRQGFRAYKVGQVNKTQYTPLNRSNTKTQSSQQPSNKKYNDLTNVSRPTTSSKKIMLKTSKKPIIMPNIRQSESPHSQLQNSNMTVSAKLQSSMRTTSHLGSSKKGVIRSSPHRFQLNNNAYLDSANKANESGEEYYWTSQNRQNAKIDLYAFKKNLLNWDDIEGILKKRFGQKVPRDLKENMQKLYKGLLPLTAKEENGQVNKFKYMQLILDQKLHPSEQRKNMAIPSSRHKISSVNPRPEESSPTNRILSSIYEQPRDSVPAQNQDIIEQQNGENFNHKTPSKFYHRRSTMMQGPTGSIDINAHDRKKGEQVKMIDLIERRLPSSQESLAFDSSELVTPQQQQSRSPTPRYQFESKNNGRESFNRTTSRSRGDSQDPASKEHISVDIMPAHERIPSFQGINLKTVNHFLNSRNRIALPENKIKECYRAMASNGQTMDKKQFSNYLVVLQDEYVMAKQAEIKHKLREIRNLFEQPNVNLGNAPASLQQILDKESPVKSKSPKRKTRLPQLISFDQESSQQAIAQKLIIEIDKLMIKNNNMAHQDNSQTRETHELQHPVDNSWRTKLTPKIQSVGKLHPLLEHYDTLENELEGLQKQVKQNQTKVEIASKKMVYDKTPLKQQTINVQHRHTPTKLSSMQNTTNKKMVTPKVQVQKVSLPVTHEKSKLPRNIEKRQMQSPKNRLSVTPTQDPVNHNVIKYQERLAKIKAEKERKLAAKSPSPTMKRRQLDSGVRSKTRQLPQHKFKTIDMDQYETEKAYDPSSGKRSASRDFCNKSVRPSHGRGTELTEGTQTDLNQSSSKRLQEKKIRYSIDEMIDKQQFIQKIVSDASSQDDNHTMNLNNYSDANRHYPKRNQSIDQGPFDKPHYKHQVQVHVAQTPTHGSILPKFGQKSRSPVNKRRAHVFKNQGGFIVTKCLPEYGVIKYTRELNQEAADIQKQTPKSMPISPLVKYERNKFDVINHQPLVTVMHQDNSSDAWCQDITQDRTLENFMRAGTPSKRIAFRPISPSRIQQNRSPREYIQPPQPNSSARRPYTPTPQFESQCHSRFEPEGFSIKSEYNSQLQDSQINFKEKIQQMKIVEKPTELQEEIVFTELDPYLELMSHDTLSVRNPQNNTSRLSHRIPVINSNKNIPERLEDIITEQQQFDLSNQKTVQIHLENQGFQMFEKQKQQLSSIQARSYNKNSEDFKNQIEIKNDEKFENDEAKDVKLWQTHDSYKHVQGGNIDSSVWPQYIKESLNKAPLRKNAFVIFNIQSGQKMGQKITDVDTRWVEKWYEIQCRSTLPNRPQQNLIIKYYSKFWTNLLKNTIDGESCLKILTTDNQLQYELHEQLEMNNIFNKKNPRGIHGEKNMPNDQVSKRLQNKWNNNLMDDDTILEHSRRTNSRFSNTPSTSTQQMKKVFKSPMTKAMMQKEKFTSQHTNPFELRTPKLNLIRTNLIEYDQRSGQKFKEFGVEHRWQSEKSTVFETTTWSKNHWENDIKHNVVLTETNRMNQMTADNEYKTGKREGTNEFGQTWKEDWAVHAITGHQKWTKVYSEPKHLRQDGFSSRWGEWREESPAQNQNHGEKWTEISKENGYFERRSEKYTEYSDATKDSSMLVKDPIVKKILIVGDGQGIINKVPGKAKQPKNGFQIKLLDNIVGQEKFYAWEITGKYDKKLFQQENFDGIIWVINSNYDLQMLKKSKEELQAIRQLESLQKVPLLLFANGLDQKSRAPEEIANILELRFIHERVWNIKSAAQGVQNAMKWLQQTILNQITQKTSLKRSGVNTFQNSDKKLIVEHWEEFKDGTLIKNIYEDDGKGKKMLEKKGIKLDLELLEDVEMVSDQYGFFKHFKTSTYSLETEIIKSLQQLIEGHKEYLEWEYSNQIMEYFGLNKVTTVKKGKDYKNQQEWSCLREYYLGEEAELVTNYGKDAEGEWKEQWHKNKLGESWAKKEGHSQGKEWFEEWYLKVNEKEEMLESKSDKWAKNDLEEWHEKWGESHIPGNKYKWFDKWNINLLNGERQGEKWSQKYHDDYTVKEHCNEKWDHNGIYEQSHY